MINSTITNKYDRLVFFDCETTGFNPDKDDQIIELAAVALISADGSTQEMDEFIYLTIKPDLPAKITELTGISNWDLATHGKPEEEVLGMFAQIMGDGSCLLAAHNAQFDLLFTAYALLRHRGSEEGKDWMRKFNRADYLDTLTVFKDRKGYPHRLENAIEHYGLTGQVENSHRAIDDTKALAAVTAKLAEERDDLASYINVFGFPYNKGVMQPTLKKVTYRAQHPGMKEPDYTLPAQLQKEVR